MCVPYVLCDKCIHFSTLGHCIVLTMVDYGGSESTIFVHNTSYSIDQLDLSI